MFGGILTNRTDDQRVEPRVRCWKPANSDRSAVLLDTLLRRSPKDADALLLRGLVAIEKPDAVTPSSGFAAR